MRNSFVAEDELDFRWASSRVTRIAPSADSVVSVSHLGLTWVLAARPASPPLVAQAALPRVPRSRCAVLGMPLVPDSTTEANGAAGGSWRCSPIGPYPSRQQHAAVPVLRECQAAEKTHVHVPACECTAPGLPAGAQPAHSAPVFLTVQSLAPAGSAAMQTWQQHQAQQQQQQQHAHGQQQYGVANQQQPGNAELWDALQRQQAAEHAGGMTGAMLYGGGAAPPMQPQQLQGYGGGVLPGKPMLYSSAGGAPLTPQFGMPSASGGGGDVAGVPSCFTSLPSFMPSHGGGGSGFPAPQLYSSGAPGGLAAMQLHQQQQQQHQMGGGAVQLSGLSSQLSSGMVMPNGGGHLIQPQPILQLSGE